MAVETPWHDVTYPCGHPIVPVWAALPDAVFQRLTRRAVGQQACCAVCRLWQWPDDVQTVLRMAALDARNAAKARRTAKKGA